MALPRTVRLLVAQRPPARAVAERCFRAAGCRDPARVWSVWQTLRADEVQRRRLAALFPQLWTAVRRSADPDRVWVGFARLASALPNPGMFYEYLRAAPDRLTLLVTILAHSQALADTLTRNAQYFHFLIAPETLARPRQKQSLAAELQRRLLPVRQPEQQYNVIRQFRRRETLRIGARDLTGRATVEETTEELSNLADVCLQAVYEIARTALQRAYRLDPAAWPADARFAVIGLGKLGGQELNYSSDVDVIFVSGEQGQFNPQLSYDEFFTKLAAEIIHQVGTTTDEGAIFRIDLRLRPEGSSGPLVRTLASYENYYAQWGETWERMALIKARPVAGDPNLGAEFVAMIQPFVYARHASAAIIQQMASLKQRIEQEIVRAERLTRHVKLGIGGIREIEFIVQALQLLHGARRITVRDRRTLRGLELLAQAGALSAAEAQTLAAAYRFLRSVEHRLQMEMDLQTHTIPDEEQALYRLARSMGFRTVAAFTAAQEQHTGAVRRIYADIIAAAETQQARTATAAAEAPDPAQLPQQLTSAGFRDVPAATSLIEKLWHGTGFTYVGSRTKELFARLLPTLLTTAAQLADPDGALLRLEQFVAAYGSRGLLYEILVSHPRLLGLLLRLGDASPFLADILTHQPDLFDEVCRGLGLAEPKGAAKMREELADAIRTRTATEPADPTTAARDAAREWHRAELLRIGLEDILGLVDLEHTLQEITALGDVCMEAALTHARCGAAAHIPFVVIGLGKFGGGELGYGADLDVLFVGGKDSRQQPAAIRVATQIIDFLAQPTAAGRLFAVDARLRPDGEKGPLASSLAAHRAYYRDRAQLWERQAMIKARVVAGDAALGRQFMDMIHQFVYRPQLTSAEIGELQAMRRRIETERGNRQWPAGEFKTGPGGLVDIEFAVQKLQLQHGYQHLQLRTARTLAALNRLTALGLLDETISSVLRRNYLFLRRVESVLRRVHNTSVARLPSAPAEQAQLARRLGFASWAEFWERYEHYASQTRRLYEQIMSR